MDFEVGVYEMRDISGGDNTSERCVMVVRTGPSPFAPHMVTNRADNRYYGRFYRRGNYESRIAQEYEVREMLERARRLYEGVEGEIQRRGYGDCNSADFGTNDYAKRLVTRYSHETEAGNEASARRVSVLLLPLAPLPSGSSQRADRREWVSWLNPEEHRYQPEPGGLFVPGPTPRPTLGGILSLKDHWKHDGFQMRNMGLEEYLLVGFDGSVELGLSSVTRQRKDWGMTFEFFGRAILVRAWQAINFTAELRSRLGLSSSYLLVLNAKNTSGGILTGFARGWQNLDPSTSVFVDLEDAPRCLETNLQIRQELNGEDFEEIGRGTWESPPPQIRDLSEELSSAFGLQDPVLLPRDEGR